jgi:hypothetical protein
MLDLLLSRFIIIKVGKYIYEEFKEAAWKVLIEREHIEDENLATKIVNVVWQRSSINTNIRHNVIKISRLAWNIKAKITCFQQNNLKKLVPNEHIVLQVPLISDMYYVLYSCMHILMKSST